MQWASASTNSHHGKGLEQGADLRSVRKAVKKMSRDGKHLEAGMARCVISGGLWTESRVWEAGYSTDG
eukprot:8088932-Karenia_brevis.AAC.1